MKILTGKISYTILVLCAVLYMLPQNIIAQTVQRVVVKEYIPDIKNPTLNANKKPLSNVEVSVKGAGSTITNENGECFLKFTMLKGGDRIVVRHFVRPGFELLNPELLNDLVIRRDDKPLEIVMISQDNAIKLSRIISQQVGAQFDKMRLRELNELDIMAVDYEKKRKAIIEKYETKLDDVDQYIDRLVRVDITRVSENESAAFKAFANGNLDEALALFDQENLISQYRQTYQALENVKEAHEKVDEERDTQQQQQNDIQYFLKTQITMLEMEGSEQSIRKAKALLEQLLEIDPFGEFQGKEYLKIVLPMKEFDYVRSFLQKHLEDSSISDETRCRLAINLATILYEEKKYDEVMSLLLPFESMMDEICEKHSDEPLYLYLPVLAEQMLGHCEFIYGTRDRAMYHYQRMFEIYLKLRDVDAMTKFYANVTYPRLVRSLRQLEERGEWGMFETIFNATFSRVQFLYAHGTLQEQFLCSRFRLGQAALYLNRNELDEGMKIIFSLIQEIDVIYKKNAPLCTDFYLLLLSKAIGYYNDNHRYKDVVRTAGKWFEISHIPYDSSMQSSVWVEMDEEMQENYKNICYMYKTALDQMPKNP